MTSRTTTRTSGVRKQSPRQIDRRSHPIIRHAYEQVLTAAARLGSFSTGTPPDTGGPISDRQEALAADDLVNFGIHARRLLDNTRTNGTLGDVAIGSKNALLPITKFRRIINVIIHHKHIEIVRTELHAGFLTGKYKLEDLPTIPKRAFSPLIVVQSDKDDVVHFQLSQLIETFQQDILSPIIDLCGEHHLFLEELG